MKAVDAIRPQLEAASSTGGSPVHFVFFGVGLLFAALSVIGCREEPAFDESGYFMGKVKSAYANESVSDLLELYSWEGVSPDRRRSIRVALEFEIDLPISSIDIRPLASVEEIKDHLAGGSLRPNLPPEYLLWLEFETSERLSYSMLVGRNVDGDLRFIVGVPVEEASATDPHSPGPLR